MSRVIAGRLTEEHVGQLLDGLRNRLLHPTVERVDVTWRTGIQRGGEEPNMGPYRDNGTLTLHVEINGGAREEC